MRYRNRTCWLPRKTRNAQVMQLKESVEWRKLQEQDSGTSMKGWTLSAKESSLNRQIRELRARLKPTPFHQSDHKHNLRLKDPHTCDWALDKSTEIDRTIDGWLNSLDKENAIVWLTGKPAQGKSVVAAYLIEHYIKTGHNCLFYFIPHDNESKRTASAVLRTLAFSLAEFDQTIAKTYLRLKRQEISLGETDFAIL